MSSLNLLQYVCPDAVSLFKKVPLKMLDFNFYWKAVTKVERNYEKLWRIYVTVWLNGNNMSVQNFCTIFVCKWTLQDRPANQIASSWYHCKQCSLLGEKYFANKSANFCHLQIPVSNKNKKTWISTEKLRSSKTFPGDLVYNF